MPTIKELYDAELKVANLIPKDYNPTKITSTGDKTPYYSEGVDAKTANLVDEKAISGLETKLSTKRYGPGMGEWGAVYSDATGKNYSKVVKKD